jgi:hypothetical protein
MVTKSNLNKQYVKTETKKFGCVWKRVDSVFHSSMLVHPHQSEKLDPDPYQFADNKPKCMEYEPS